MIIGITGKSGSGKSTIAKYIIEQGYDVIDVDTLHKEAAMYNGSVIDEIFNEHCKPKTTDEFFNNKELREEINELLFPWVHREVKNLVDNHKGLLFLDAPLLYDMKLTNFCHKIWYIYCFEEENIKRLMNRLNISAEQAKIRINTIDFEWEREGDIDARINTTYYIDYPGIHERLVRYEKRNLCW